MTSMKPSSIYTSAFWVFILVTVSAVSLAAGILWSTIVSADQEKKPRVIYPKRTELDFEGAQIEGELRNPAEFYFQHKPDEKFDSLVKRRKHFHREMLRDVVMSR